MLPRPVTLRAKPSLGLCLILVSLSTSPAPVFADDNWKLEKTKDKVAFYLRDYPGTSIPEFKAVTQIQATMASILAVLLDIKAYPEWVHQCTRAFTIDAENDQEQYVYQVSRLPLARDRDMILHAELSHSNHGRVVVIQLEAEPDYCKKNKVPACKQIDPSRYIRVEESLGSYRLKRLNGSLVELTWQQYINPGGKLPSWLIRALISDIPVKTLNALHDMVQRPEYQNSRLVFDGGTLLVVGPENQ